MSIREVFKIIEEGQGRTPALRDALITLAKYVESMSHGEDISSFVKEFSERLAVLEQKVMKLESRINELAEMLINVGPKITECVANIDKLRGEVEEIKKRQVDVSGIDKSFTEINEKIVKLARAIELLMSKKDDNPATE